MKKPERGHNWFFVDESGDPTFYDRNGNLIVGQAGCSPLLLLGFVEMRNPRRARRAIRALQQEILGDPYLQGIPSLSRTAVAFHAKDDTPEVRERFFKLIMTLDFSAQFIAARKIEKVFRNNFQASERRFYDFLVEKLFRNVLHRYTHNHIIFAKRGSRDRQEPLTRAIEAGQRDFENRWRMVVNTRIVVQAQTAQNEPCLSIVDYLLWAVQRAFVRKEMRYYRFVEEKVSLLVDWYDTARYPNNWYTKKNPFDINKISPL